MVKVGINGFGRIGRLVLRVAAKERRKKCASSDLPQIVAINDPYLTADHMANLLKYDSTHGLYQGDIQVLGNTIKVDGQIIDVVNEKSPDKIPWGKSCVEYVIDATGLYKTYDKACVHLKDGVQRVILTAPSKGKDVPMFVFGVNHGDYSPENKIISNASCTTNCLAPLVKVVHESFGIEQGLMTTIHAVTPSQNTLDGPAKKNYRIGRGAFQNIIPSSTGAAKAMAKIMPEMNKRLTGISARVPVANASMVDLTCTLKKSANYDVIKCRIKEASDTHMKNILGYTEEQIVSSDIIGDSRSSIFDAGASVALNDNFVKLITWYDNEYGYACRVIDMVKYMVSREC